MQEQKEQRGMIVMTIFVMAFIMIFSLCNIGLLAGTMEKVCAGKLNFEEFREDIKARYVSDDLYEKEFFINLNGLFARATGRRQYNDIVLTTNGLLTDTVRKADMTEVGNEIVYLSQFATEKGIPFVFVQAPYKEDLQGEMMPEGLESFANENADQLLQILQAGNVNTLDLRPMFVGTAEMAEEYYFVTDHHWSYTGAFVAYGELVKLIQDVTSESIDMTYTDINQWDAHTLEDWFLGSRGKRVGSWFQGVDDFTYYTPKFDTNMSYINPKHNTIYTGDFATVNIRTEYLDERDYLGDNVYCLYSGGNYPLVKFKNEEAPSDLKVLLIGDSFSIPVYTYMSTMFREVDFLDMRYYTDATAAQYVDWNNPDVVVMMINQSGFENDSYTNLGASDYVMLGEPSEVTEYGDIKVELDDFSNNYEKISLKRNTTYTITFDNVTFGDTKPEGVSVVLYDRKTKEKIAVEVFDVEYCRNNGTFSWTFETPDRKGQYELLLYAGLATQTSGIEATYEGVKLYIH